ncbi:MAG TPA: hypothetical protein VJP85_13515 [Candidatus Baltobacteraceae bacterium]|nr:hypothetical protein [Candidatus Baltobacteraceae bacterium]
MNKYLRNPVSAAVALSLLAFAALPAYAAHPHFKSATGTIDSSTHDVSISFVEVGLGTSTNETSVGASGTANVRWECYNNGGNPPSANNAKFKNTSQSVVAPPQTFPVSGVSGQETASGALTLDWPANAAPPTSGCPGSTMYWQQISGYWSNVEVQDTTDGATASVTLSGTQPFNLP